MQYVEQKYLEVGLVGDRPQTRVISLAKFLELRNDRNNTVVRSVAGLNNLRLRCNDIKISGDAVVYPELNTLFSFLS